MSREITTHKLNGLNEVITITAGDPGSGGAPYRYDIVGTKGSLTVGGITAVFGANLRFQNGPIKAPEDANGITNEALLAVLIDRMRSFQHPLVNTPDGKVVHDFKQRGVYACRENAIALTHLEEAMMWLQARTRERLSRGVEGSHAA